MFERLFKKKDIRKDEPFANDTGCYQWLEKPTLAESLERLRDANRTDFLLQKIDVDEYIRINNEIEEIARGALLKKLDRLEESVFQDEYKEEVA